MAGRVQVMAVDRLCYRFHKLSFQGLMNARLPATSSTAWKKHNFFLLQSTGAINKMEKYVMPAVSSNEASAKIQERLKSYSTPSCISQKETSSKWQTEYICPGVESGSLPPVVILDIANSVVGFYDCPNLLERLTDLIAPPVKSPMRSPPPSQKPPAKHAHNILKIRRRKMNRHLLKKFRLRMKFALRKQRLMLRRKKESKLRLILNKFRIESEAFDAEQYVKDQLSLAKKGGYKIEILDK